ncbi:MAG TPA: hypothetical protein VFC19_21325 [Candidatus Limnocylindrales bacterium]|nr:hypothetical protein [Candidatus Limnocylindrales bacterium]
MESLRLSVRRGTVCADAFVEAIGWQGWKCGTDGARIAVGVPGRRLDALQFRIA